MSKTEKTEPETPTTDSPEAGGGETILDRRVTALEVGMTQLVTKAEMVEVKEVLKHVATKDELKDATSGLKADMAEIKEILKHVVTKDDIKILDRVATQDDIKILDRVATQDDIKILDRVATQDDIKILDRVATKDDIKILDRVATKDDIKILDHVATQEDMQRQRVWILSGAIGVVFTLVLIGLGAYRILVG